MATDELFVTPLEFRVVTSKIDELNVDLYAELTAAT